MGFGFLVGFFCWWWFFNQQENDPLLLRMSSCAIVPACGKCRSFFPALALGRYSGLCTAEYIPGALISTGHVRSWQITFESFYCTDVGWVLSGNALPVSSFWNWRCSCHELQCFLPCLCSSLCHFVTVDLLVLWAVNQRCNQSPGCKSDSRASFPFFLSFPPPSRLALPAIQGSLLKELHSIYLRISMLLAFSRSNSLPPPLTPCRRILQDVIPYLHLKIQN